MKLNATKFYTSLFVIVLFLQLYLPSFKINAFIQIACLLLYFFYEKVSFSKSFLKQFLPIFYIFCIGLIGTIIHKYALYNILKDFFHFIKPILGILIGYLFYKKINSFHLFIKTIVVSGIISAIIHFFIILVYSDVSSVNSVREFGRDNFLELFALFFLIYYKKFQHRRVFESKGIHQFALVILSFSNLLYFSRTMMIIAFVFLLSIYGYTIITRKTLQIIGVFMLLVVCFYAYLFSIKIDRNAAGVGTFLYKVKNAPGELFETKIDRENHKDLWDHWRGYEAKRALVLMEKSPSSYVFGTGHGSLVNLKFKAPLDKEGLKFISELHNGYIYLLYKVGFLGLIIYIVVVVRWYLKIYQNKNFITILISVIGITFIFSTLTITGIYNTRDIIIFILGGLLFFNDKMMMSNPAE